MRRVSRIYMRETEKRAGKKSRALNEHMARASHYVETRRRVDAATFAIASPVHRASVHLHSPVTDSRIFRFRIRPRIPVRTELQRASVAIKGAYCVGETIHHSFTQEPDK